MNWLSALRMNSFNLLGIESAGRVSFMTFGLDWSKKFVESKLVLWKDLAIRDSGERDGHSETKYNCRSG